MTQEFLADGFTINRLGLTQQKEFVKIAVAESYFIYMLRHDYVEEKCKFKRNQGRRWGVGSQLIYRRTNVRMTFDCLSETMKAEKSGLKYLKC